MWRYLFPAFHPFICPFELRHDKTNKVSVRPAKTQISLGIRPVWSESSLSAWRNLGSLAILWAHSEDSDQTGRMPRLIWVFAGRTLILLVLLCRGSFVNKRSLANPGICQSLLLTKHETTFIFDVQILLTQSSSSEGTQHHPLRNYCQSYFSGKKLNLWCWKRKMSVDFSWLSKT